MARRLKKGKKKKNVSKTVLEEDLEFAIGALSHLELLHGTEGYVDPSEETVQMTRREMNIYMKKKMKEYSEVPKINQINPFIDLEKQLKELVKEVKVREQQLLKVQKDFEKIYRDLLQFFRHHGIVPKMPAKSDGVSADFPILPESLPPFEFLTGGKYFVDLPSCKKY